MATSKKAKNSQKPSAEPQLAAANAERVAKIEVPPLPKPDWALWGQMRRASLVEAVLLSLDIAPADPEHLSGSRTWYYFYPNEVARRLAIAANHLGRDGPLHPLDWDGLVTRTAGRLGKPKRCKSTSSACGWSRFMTTTMSSCRAAASAVLGFAFN